MPGDEKSIIQSVDRAITLLKEIASTPGRPRNLAELAGFLGIDRSSVFRLLSTLSRHGLVMHGGGEKGYKLGYSIYTLAASLREQEKITDLANPFLKKMVRETGENAHLAVMTGSLCVFVDRERGTRTLTANTNIGDTEELYCTAVGKSLISRCTRAELDALFADGVLEAYTPNTITDIAVLHRELEGVRKEGLAVDNEEFDPNCVCIAAPVINFEGKVEAAVGLSGPSPRIKPRLKELMALVKDIGRELSALLGGTLL